MKARASAEVLGDVEANASGADDGHRTTDLASAANHIDVGHRLAVVDAGNQRYTGNNSGRQHDFIGRAATSSPR